MKWTSWQLAIQEHGKPGFTRPSCGSSTSSPPSSPFSNAFQSNGGPCYCSLLPAANPVILFQPISTANHPQATAPETPGQGVASSRFPARHKRVQAHHLPQRWCFACTLPLRSHAVQSIRTSGTLPSQAPQSIDAALPRSPSRLCHAPVPRQNQARTGQASIYLSLANLTDHTSVCDCEPLAAIPLLPAICSNPRFPQEAAFLPRPHASSRTSELLTPYPVDDSLEPICYR